MAVFNVAVDVIGKKVTVENRRHTKEIFPDVAIALNAEDPRPYKKVESPIASIIDDTGKLIVDDKMVPIDVVKGEIIDIEPIEGVKP